MARTHTERRMGFMAFKGHVTATYGGHLTAEGLLDWPSIELRIVL